MYPRKLGTSSTKNGKAVQPAKVPTPWGDLAPMLTRRSPTAT